MPSRLAGSPWRALQGPWPPIAAVLAVQGVILVLSSLGQYRSDNLSFDYAIFNQGWYLMAHGHLNPADTLQHTTYLNQHGEFIMLAIAPLYWLNQNQGFTLLVLQAAAIVGSIAVAASWLLAVARRWATSARNTGIGVGVFVILCATNAWIYAVPYEDFHFESFALLFTVAAGRALYLGHRRIGVMWVVLALLTGDVAATYVAAMGLGLAIACRAARRDGLVMAGAGLAWVLGIGAIGANAGSPIRGYAYLGGKPAVASTPGGMVDIVTGGLLHPSRAVNQLVASKLSTVRNLVPSGSIGFLDPLMAIPVLAAVITNGLNVLPNFTGSPFQNLPVYVFGAFGTALVCLRLAGGRAWRNVGAVVVALAAVGGAVAFDIPQWGGPSEIRFSVNSAAAYQLGAVRAMTPPSAEVVSSSGVVGRFSGRTWVYGIYSANFPVPVRAATIEFVLAPTAGNQHVAAAAVAAAGDYVVTALGAQPVYTGSEVRAYVWHPRVIAGSVVLP